MKFKYYEKHIEKKTKGRYDVTPIFLKPEVFKNLVDDLVRPFKKVSFNKIAGIEALGFIIGGATANKLNISFIPIRKQGKLPGFRKTIFGTSFTDYSGKRKTFEINKNSVKKSDKVLIVDEWLETGAQVKASINLVEKLGGKVVGISVLNTDKKQVTLDLRKKHNLHAINFKR